MANDTVLSLLASVFFYRLLNKVFETLYSCLGKLVCHYFFEKCTISWLELVVLFLDGMGVKEYAPLFWTHPLLDVKSVCLGVLSPHLPVCSRAWLAQFDYQPCSVGVLLFGIVLHWRGPHLQMWVTMFVVWSSFLHHSCLISLGLCSHMTGLVLCAML